MCWVRATQGGVNAAEVARQLMNHDRALEWRTPGHDS